ncbi:hypothetical protein [Shewanella cyperi]|uniref:hypothetical protein n=1 Tax=Shewanella cyperi TaxID=2814292 RepID=UPI001A93C24C|nr:hypothetical protein [Shewanella cyperi]QSX39225.1 hypothetical protein JYB84_09080 [Shewanella cyperi]
MLVLVVVLASKATVKHGSNKNLRRKRPDSSFVTKITKAALRVGGKDKQLKNKTGIS